MQVQAIFNSRLKRVEVRLRKDWLVAVVTLAVVAASAIGGYLYWASGKSEERRLQQQRKVARENQAKTTYNDDFARAFTGLSWEGFSKFYDRFWLDQVFFDSKNWQLNTLTCDEDCNLVFTRGKERHYSLVELRLNGQSVKPQFDSNTLQYNDIDYLGSFRTRAYPELTTDAAFDKSKVFSECTSRLVELYSLSNSLAGLASVTVELPAPVTTVSGYPWALNSDMKYGSLTLANINNDNLEVLKHVLKPDTLVTDLTVNPGSTDVRINYFCI